MSCNKDWFENYQETNNGVNIYLEDDRSHPVKGYSGISMTLPNGSVKHIQNDACTWYKEEFDLCVHHKK